MDFEERTTGFQELFQIILARKFLVIGGFLCVAVVSVIGTLRLPPVYEVTARILVEPPELPYLETASLSYGAREAFIANQKEILRSRVIAERVVKDLGLEKKIGTPSLLENFFNRLFRVNPVPAEEAVRYLQKNLYVGYTGGPNIIEIGLKSTDPEEGALIVNTIAQVYINYTYEASITRLREVRDFIAQQMRIARQKLSEAERALEEFKQREKIVDVAREKDSILTRLSELNTLLSGELAEFSDKDPRVVRAKEEIRRLTARLEALPQKESELARLNRAVKSNEDIYLLLLKKFEDARISELAELQGMGSARLIDPATPPPYPLRKQKLVLIVLGCVLGSAFGLGMAFFVEYRDTTVKSPRELEKHFGVRVVGIIPETPRRKKRCYAGFEL